MKTTTLRLLSYECDEQEFHRDFSKLLAKSTGLVLILSAFLYEFGFERYLSTFKILIARGVRVCVFIQEPEKWSRRSDETLPAGLKKELSKFEQLISRLEKIGVHVTIRKKVHVKVIIIDDQIMWYGSLNVLSHRDNEESMTYFNSAAKVAWAISRFRLDTCQRCLRNPQFRMFPKQRPPVKKRMIIMWQLLAERRIDLGYSQNEIAKLIGISPSHLSEMVNGKRDTKLTIIMKVCDVLDYEIVSVPRYLLPTLADLTACDDD